MVGRSAASVGTPYSLWYHFGPQGETRQLTNAGGATVDTYVYTAYGAPGPTTGTDRNPFRYGGQFGYYTDPGGVAGIMLCGARWYNPYTARWMTRDPIGYEGGENLYAYCWADPVDGRDEDGLDVTIGPPDHPWLVFGWEGTKAGLVTGGAVLADTFTLGLVSSKSHANDPGYAGSSICASVGREALVTAGTMGLAEAWHTARAGRAVTAAMGRARAATGAGRGSAYGTRAHMALKRQIDGLGSRFIRAEQSYLNGQPVRYGTRGSVRVDVEVRRLFGGGPKRINDLKTAGGVLTKGRAAQIQSHLPKRCPVNALKWPR